MMTKPNWKELDRSVLAALADNMWVAIQDVLTDGYYDDQNDYVIPAGDQNVEDMPPAVYACESAAMAVKNAVHELEKRRDDPRPLFDL